MSLIILLENPDSCIHTSCQYYIISLSEHMELFSPLTQPKPQKIQHQAPATTVQARSPWSVQPAGSICISLAAATTSGFDSVEGGVSILALYALVVLTCTPEIERHKRPRYLYPPTSLPWRHQKENWDWKKSRLRENIG